MRAEALDEIAGVLRGRVVGQEAAVDRLCRALVRLGSPLRDPNRPFLSALLLGPTGVGKTETARALAQALFGSDDALLRVACEEYSHGYEVAKLFGSPPGYVGYNVEPIFSQANVHAAYHDASKAGKGLVGREPDLFGEPVSVVLFDEVEKAHPALWNALLGLLDHGMVTLGQNGKSSFRRAIVLMTSNVGGEEIGNLLAGRFVGFGTGTAIPETVGMTAVKAAERRFSPEFLNRFDEVCAYEPLAPEALGRVLDLQLAEIERRARDAGWALSVEVPGDVRAWLLEKGTGGRYGARNLRRTIERELADPLARKMLESDEPRLGMATAVAGVWPDRASLFFSWRTE